MVCRRLLLGSRRRIYHLSRMHQGSFRHDNAARLF
jgi:hypothetical protein